MAEPDDATKSLIAALLVEDKPEAGDSSGDGVGEASTDDGEFSVALMKQSSGQLLCLRMQVHSSRTARIITVIRASFPDQMLSVPKANASFSVNAPRHVRFGITCLSDGFRCLLAI